MDHFGIFLVEEAIEAQNANMQGNKGYLAKVELFSS